MRRRYGGPRIARALIALLLSAGTVVALVSPRERLRAPSDHASARLETRSRSAP